MSRATACSRTASRRAAPDIRSHPVTDKPYPISYRGRLTPMRPGPCALALLGRGMGITVAPLSTTVVNALDETRAGPASGVDSAVAGTILAAASAVIGAFGLSADDGKG